MEGSFVGVIPGPSVAAQIGFEIVASLNRAGAEATAIFVAAGPLSDRAKSEGMTYRIVSAADADSGSFRERVNGARAELEPLQPGVVYVNSVANSPWAVAAKQLGARVVLHAHELEWELGRLLNTGATCLDLCAAADLLVAAGGEVITSLQRKLGYLPDDVVNIGPIVDIAEIRDRSRQKWQAQWRYTRPFNPSSRGAVASYGAPLDQNGFDVFLETARLLPERDFLWLDNRTGERPQPIFDRGALEPPANFYYGVIDNHYPLLAQSDLIVLIGREPRSRAEIVELAALNVPVIGFTQSLDDATGFLGAFHILHGKPDSSRLAMTIGKFEAGAAASRHALLSGGPTLAESPDFKQLIRALRERKLIELAA